MAFAFPNLVSGFTTVVPIARLAHAWRALWSAQEVVMAEIIRATDDTTPDELTEAIANLVTASRKIEALIDMAGNDTKRCRVYRDRWDSLADKIEMLVGEVLARERDERAVVGYSAGNGGKPEVATQPRP